MPINLESPPIPLSWKDQYEGSDLLYGEDPGTVPTGPDGEEIRWKGEQIDGYAEVADPYEQRKKRVKAAARMQFDRAVQRELPHVQPAPEPVRLYVARVRAAMRLNKTAVDVHEAFYEGKTPEGLDKLERSAFAREARWVKRAAERGAPTGFITGDPRLDVAHLPGECRRCRGTLFDDSGACRRCGVPRVDPRKHLQEGDISQGDVQEAMRRPARGRAAGRAYHVEGEAFLDKILGVNNYESSDLIGQIWDAWRDLRLDRLPTYQEFVNERKQHYNDEAPVDQAMFQSAVDQIRATDERFQGPDDSDAQPISDAEKATLVAKANHVTKSSRIRGGPTLNVNSDRESILRWLQWEDRNGVYEDSERFAEGWRPLGLAGAWEALANALREYEIEPGPRQAARRVGVDQGMTGFAQNDRVQSDHDDTSKGVVEEVQADGAVKVRRDVGGDVTYSPEAAKEQLKRQAGNTRWPGPTDKGYCEHCGDASDETVCKACQAEEADAKKRKAAPKQANQRGVLEQNHAPRGAHGDAEKGLAGKASANGDVVINDVDTYLQPENELIAVLRWPNLTVLSAAIPKMAAKDWLDGIDTEVNRELGTWRPDRTAYEFEARFASRENARRFAKKLVESYQIQPASIRAAYEQPDTRKMPVVTAGKKTGLRVDTAHRVLLPGGYVFALEGSASPGSFQIGEGVLFADELTNVLTEGKVAAVGPELVIVAGYDNQQYAFARGIFRKIHLARLGLQHARLGMLPHKQKVVVGSREGSLLDFDDTRARVLFEDGPRTFPIDRVTALLRVADLQ